VFTGLIEDLGRIEEVSPLATGRRLRIATELPTAEMAIGASISVSGACMTVTERGERSFVVDVSAESLRKTTLGHQRSGDRVNLERSLRLSDRIGGHLVTGHVDGIGQLLSLVEEGESAIFTFGLPADLGRSTVEKGSIAVDGISLTCFKCVNDRFDVAIIAHTRKVTTLGNKQVGDRVNIETDLLGKYVARWLEPRAASDAQAPHEE
jgi:riboflavin synthase